MPTDTNRPRGPSRAPLEARRTPVDGKKKEEMLAVLIRNPKAYDVVADMFKVKDCIRALGGPLGLVWKLVRHFRNTYAELPGKVQLESEIHNALAGNESLLAEEEKAEVDEFLTFAFDDREHGRNIATSGTHLRVAVATCKEVLEELVTADLQDNLTKEGTLPADVTALLDVGRSRLDQVRSLTDVDVTLAFPEGWDQRPDAALTSTGCATLDAFMGGGWRAGECLLFMAPYGSCKCLGKGTPILMFDGTVKLVEDVKVGDMLMGPDSLPRAVVSLARGREQMYRVVPDKGDAYVVNESHILSLKRSPRYAGDTHKIVNIAVRDYVGRGSYFKNQHMGWRTGVEFPPRPVPVDPYFLGLWLGDGHAGTPRVTTADPEIVDYLAAFADTHGLRCRYVAPTGKAATYAIVGGMTGGEFNSNPVTAGLRTAGVLDDKHVPELFKANAREVRLQVLAGLLDSDGSLGNNCYQYVSAREVLADDVLYLARSLGLAAYKSERTTTAVTDGPAFRSFYVTISGHTDEIPCKIARKQATPRRQKKDPCVTGIRVLPVGVGDFYGFEIAGPDGCETPHLFLLGDFTVTHNTTLACHATAELIVQCAAQAAAGQVRTNKKGEPMTPVVVLVFTESDATEYRNRLMAHLATVPWKRLAGMTSLADLSTGTPGATDATEYELSRFADAIKGDRKHKRWVPEQTRVRNAVTIANRHLVLVDCTESEDNPHKIGVGGMSEVANVVTGLFRKRPNTYPIAIWIDHLSGLIDRVTTGGEGAELDEGQVRRLLTNMPRVAIERMGKPLRCPVGVFHQFAGAVQNKGVTAKYHHSDAEGSKSIGKYANFAVVCGKVDANLMCQFDVTKHRREPPTATRIVRIDGDFSRLVDCTDTHGVETGRGVIMTREELRVSSGIHRGGAVDVNEAFQL